MSKRQPTTTVTFKCTYGRCETAVSAPLGSLLEMLNICAECQAVRVAAGLKKQREAMNG